MSYTIVYADDNIEIRGTISTRAELEELINKLSHPLFNTFAQGKDHEHDTAAAEPVRPSLPAPARSGCTGGHTEAVKEGPSIFDSAGR